MDPDSSLTVSLTPQCFARHNWGCTFDKWHFIVRLFVCGFFLSVVIANTITAMVLPTMETQCMWDGLFELTKNLNGYLATNPTVKNGLLIVSSILVDFQVLFITIRFVFFGKSWRAPIAMFSFYCFRGFIQVPVT